jgi:phosphoribosyl 1,2-cyclic phosphodiesterase
MFLLLTTLASGSSGNCLLVSNGDTHLLIDAGISARRITCALKELGIAPDDLSGVLITHEHSDHIAGLATLTKRRTLPVYASYGTGRQLCYRIAAFEDVLRPFRPGDALEIGDFEITTFSTLHDTPESVGYAVTDGTRKAAVVTDLGIVTDEVRNSVSGCDLLVVETNHDPEWVVSGPYPPFLKARILGDHGHLSNDAGAALACFAVQGGARTLVLAHLSAENNTPRRALDTVCCSLERIGAQAGRDVAVAVAPRAECGICYEV